MVPAPARRQGGAALLLFMLIVVIGASYMLLSRLNASTIRTQSTIDTVEALKIAKEALLGYAASYPDLYGATNPNAGPGHLPCPDTDGNGSPNTPCGPGAIKWLPTRKLGMDNLRDGSGSRLWYAIGDGFRNNPITTPLNTDVVDAFQPSQFLSVDGADDVVAVIIAPGEPLDGQDRAAGPGVVSNYLEGENSNGDTTFSSDVVGGNDLLAVITRRELMAAVEKRVLGEVRNRLDAYYLASDSDPAKRFYPYAALLGSQAPYRVGWEKLRKGYLPVDGAKGKWKCECEAKSMSGMAGLLLRKECTCEAENSNTITRDITLSSSNGFQSAGGSCTLNGGGCSCHLTPGANGVCTSNPVLPPSLVFPSVSLDMTDGTFTEPENGCSLSGIQPAPASCLCGGPDNGKCEAKLAGQGAPEQSPPLVFPSWFTTNQWDQLIYYSLAQGCEEKGGNGCASNLLRVGLLDDVGAVAIASGPELDSTNCNGSTSHDQRGRRPSQDVCDYLDSQENTNGDDVYTDRSTPITGNYWDRIHIVKP